MGQQQLLIALIAVVIVGIAIVVALGMFSSGSIESQRNAIIGDLLQFAQQARSYYWRPRMLGGGDSSFEGITLRTISSVTENEHGRYYIEEATKDYVIIVGVGRVISGSDSIRVNMRVNEKTNQLTIIN